MKYSVLFITLLASFSNFCGKPAIDLRINVDPESVMFFGCEKRNIEEELLHGCLRLNQHFFKVGEILESSSYDPSKDMQQHVFYGVHQETEGPLSYDMYDLSKREWIVVDTSKYYSRTGKIAPAFCIGYNAAKLIA